MGSQNGDSLGLRKLHRLGILLRDDNQKHLLLRYARISSAYAGECPFAIESFASVRRGKAFAALNLQEVHDSPSQLHIRA
jgi:hypothetical protein